MNARKTKYQRVPMQTQAMGTQNLCLDVGELSHQSAILVVAEALGLLIDGNPGQSDSVQAIIRKCGLSEEDVAKVPNIGKALPQLPKLDFDNLEAVARQLAEFAQDDGPWRRHFELTVQGLIDQKIAELQPRLTILEEQLIAQFDFATTMRELTALQQRWSREAKGDDIDPWQSSYSDRLQKSSESIRRFGVEISQRSRWRRWIGGALSKEDRDYLLQQFERDIRMAECRVQQMKRETNQRIKKRMTDNERPDSLAGFARRLGKQCEQLQSLRTELQNSIRPLTDTVTTVQLVHTTTEQIGNEKTLHDLMVGAFEVNQRGAGHVAAKLRTGLAFKSVLSPSGLANLDARQAMRVLDAFCRSYFAVTAASVLAIDLTEEALHLPLARTLAAVCQRASPYLRFPHIARVQPIVETYLHCNPDVRPIVEALRPSAIHFSNPATDDDFDLPQRHVLTITTNILAAGHTRPEYASARYRRDKMIGEGIYASIYPFDQPMARPLFLAVRPDDERDSIELFELACEFGRIASIATSDGQPVFTVAGMDETVRFCFDTQVARRVIGDADHFVGMLDEAWFADFVRAHITNLRVDWHSELILQMDRASASTIAESMVAIGILERKATTAGFRFAVPYQQSMTLRPELYRIETKTLAGLTRSQFIRKLLTVDELYTRVVEDVITGQAMGKIPYRRLTAFAKQLVDDRRSGVGLAVNTFFTMVDTVPMLYLLSAAWLMFKLGDGIRRHAPTLVSTQETAGAGVFVLLVLRRMLWESPSAPADVIGVLTRAAAFGVVTLGVAGTIGIAWISLWRLLAPLRVAFRKQTDSWRRWIEQKRRITRTIDLPSPLVQERERIECIRRDEQSRKNEADRHRRAECRLKAELELEFAADNNRREKLNELMKKFADESLPVEAYEQRLATICDAVTRHNPVRAKQYSSLQEILDDFDRQIHDVDASTQSDFEKESLKALINMERNISIQRFIQR